MVFKIIKNLIYMSLLGSLAFVMYDASTSQAIAQREHISDFMISIPAIDVQAPIVAIHARRFDSGTTWDTTQLDMNVGLLYGLGTFGEVGNVVLGGHSERERGVADVFYDLDEVSVGDEIKVVDHNKTYYYMVTELKTVDVRDMSILHTTNSERLTIMTCDTDSFNTTNGEYAERVVVIAERIYYE